MLRFQYVCPICGLTSPVENENGELVCPRCGTVLSINLYTEESVHNALFPRTRDTDADTASSYDTATATPVSVVSEAVGRFRAEVFSSALAYLSAYRCLVSVDFDFIVDLLNDLVDKAVEFTVVNRTPLNAKNLGRMVAQKLLLYFGLKQQITLSNDYRHALGYAFSIINEKTKNRLRRIYFANAGVDLQHPWIRKVLKLFEQKPRSSLHAFLLKKNFSQQLSVLSLSPVWHAVPRLPYHREQYFSPENLLLFFLRYVSRSALLGYSVFPRDSQFISYVSIRVPKCLLEAEMKVEDDGVLKYAEGRYRLNPESGKVVAVLLLSRILKKYGLQAEPFCTLCTDMKTVKLHVPRSLQVWFKKRGVELSRLNPDDYLAMQLLAQTGHLSPGLYYVYKFRRKDGVKVFKTLLGLL